jgi:hypothetical protein
MQGTLVIYQYDKNKMCEILDNLIVFNQITKTSYTNITSYEVKTLSNGVKNGNIHRFTITAKEQPALVFYEIGKQCERLIEKPIRDTGPQPA